MLCFYLRIFPQSSFRRAIFVTMGLVSTCGIGFVLMQVFQCLPLSYVWEGWKGTYGPHTCLNVNALALAAGACSIAQDMAILALPIPAILSLNASARSKTAAMFMFGLGVFILITSCIRLPYIVHFARSRNPTWDYTDCLVWSGLEVSVSILVTSLPAIRVLLSRAWPTLFGATVGGGRTPRQLSQRTPLSSHEVATHRVVDGLKQDLHGSVDNNHGKQQLTFTGMLDKISYESSESELELGDKLQDHVCTEIGIGDDETTPPGTSTCCRMKAAMSGRRRDEPDPDSGPLRKDPVVNGSEDGIP